MLASASSPHWFRVSEKGNSMATKKQIAANRRNAQKCTGPKSPQGKAASSMNNLRHGLRARTIILPGEKQEDFDEIHAGLQDQYQPQNPAEQHLVDQAAIAQWKLARAEAYEARSFAKDSSIEAQAAIFGPYDAIPVPPGARLFQGLQGARAHPSRARETAGTSDAKGRKGRKER